MSDKKPPSPAELEILQQLWARGPLSVREVHDAIGETRPVVYTTVLKIMQLMFERGLLTRQVDGRRHLYTAAVSESSTQDNLLDRFLDKAFSGSAGELVLRTLGKHQPSADELSRIREVLAQYDDQSADEVQEPTFKNPSNPAEQ